MMGASGQEPRRHDVTATERQELLGELRRIADTLHLCAGRLQALIDRLAAGSEAATQADMSVLATHVAADEVDSAPEPRRARVSFGGGESVISDLDALLFADADPGATADLTAAAEAHAAAAEAHSAAAEAAAAVERTPRVGPSFAGFAERAPTARRWERLERLDAERAARARDTGVRRHELLAVTELVHLGYSREDISRRLRARWGDRASAILADAFEDHSDGVGPSRP